MYMLRSLDWVLRSQVRVTWIGLVEDLPLAGLEVSQSSSMETVQSQLALKVNVAWPPAQSQEKLLSPTMVISGSTGSGPGPGLSLLPQQRTSMGIVSKNAQHFLFISGCF